MNPDDMNGIYRAPQQESVLYGRPWEEILAAELDRCSANRVFVVASTHYAASANLEAAMRAALGARFVGMTSGVREHAPREDVVRIADEARRAGADFLLAIGGGSVIDATKVALLCLATDARDTEQLGALAHTRKPSLQTQLPVRMGAIPTTLSGAEFTYFAGCTDMATRTKEGYFHPLMAPRFVILDAAVTRGTPQSTWLSTGVRSLDHAVEALCSKAATPIADAAALHALKVLSASLVRNHDEPTDDNARLQSQCGVWLAAVGLQSGVPMGASHGIGHALGGTAGVPHGVTSCLMLPHVLRWNHSVNADRQAAISAALGEPGADAGDVVARLVERLGLPNRLRDVGVAREQFAEIADHAFHDPWTEANPRRLRDAREIVDLLEKAW